MPYGIEKQNLLQKGIGQIDLLKLLLELCWEIQALDTKKFTHISLELVEIGKMLGGWKRQLLSKTPVQQTGREKQ